MPPNNFNLNKSRTTKPRLYQEIAERASLFKPIRTSPVRQVLPILNEPTLLPHEIVNLDEVKQAYEAFIPKISIIKEAAFGDKTDSTFRGVSKDGKVTVVMTPATADFQELNAQVQDIIRDSRAARNTAVTLRDVTRIVEKLLDQAPHSDNMRYSVFLQRPFVQADYDLTLSQGRCSAMTLFYSSLLQKGDNIKPSNRINLKSGRQRRKLTDFMVDQSNRIKHPDFAKYAYNLFNSLEQQDGNLQEVSSLPTANWLPEHVLKLFLEVHNEYALHVLYEVNEEGFQVEDHKLSLLLFSSLAKDIGMFSRQMLTNVHMYRSIIHMDEAHTWTSQVSLSINGKTKEQVDLKINVGQALAELTALLAQRIFQNFNHNLAQHKASRVLKRQSFRNLYSVNSIQPKDTSMSSLEDTEVTEVPTGPQSQGEVEQTVGEPLTGEGVVPPALPSVTTISPELTTTQRPDSSDPESSVGSGNEHGMGATGGSPSQGKGEDDLSLSFSLVSVASPKRQDSEITEVYNTQGELERMADSENVPGSLGSVGGEQAEGLNVQISGDREHELVPVRLPISDDEDKKDEEKVVEEKKMEGIEERNEERKVEDAEEKENGDIVGEEKEVEKEELDEGELDIPGGFFPEIPVTNSGVPSESEDEQLL